MVLSLVGLAAAIIVLIHAFQASVGQGLLCLCVPFYIIYYVFARFEHEKKNLIIAALLGSWILAILLNGLSIMSNF